MQFWTLIRLGAPLLTKKHLLGKPDLRKQIPAVNDFLNVVFFAATRSVGGCQNLALSCGYLSWRKCQKVIDFIPFFCLCGS